MAYGESNGLKGPTGDRNTLRARYLENSCRCYLLARVTNY